MSDDTPKTKTGRDELTDEQNARLDKTMAESEDVTRWFNVTADGVEHLDDFRDSEHGLMQAVLFVKTPDGLDVFGVPRAAPRTITQTILDSGVLRITDGPDGPPMMTYSPTGWHNVSPATGTEVR